jgi:hypothetical protein
MLSITKEHKCTSRRNRGRERHKGLDKKQRALSRRNSDWISSRVCFKIEDCSFAKGTIKSATPNSPSYLVESLILRRLQIPLLHFLSCCHALPAFGLGARFMRNPLGMLLKSLPTGAQVELLSSNVMNRSEGYDPR